MSNDAATLTPLVGFCAVLRDAGLTVGTDDALAFTEAVASLDPGRLEDTYWAGRATLTHRLSDIPVYNECFTQFFLGGHKPPEQDKIRRRNPTAESDAVFTVPSGERPSGSGEEHQATLGLLASAVIVDHTKDFADCTDDELSAIRRIMAAMRLAPPKRRSRRHERFPKGPELDMRQIARESMRNHGEPVRLSRRRRKDKPRRLVLLLDVSGSMADYSRNLLQFAHSVRRGGRSVEVFCFGTSLTRITATIRHRDPDEALRRAGEEVVDWAGGTQIGASLNDFVRRYGRRGIARGAIVVICSDGLDRGDPALLDSALERLGRLAYRIVWMNPMKGEDDAEYVAASLGMSVALPHIDLVWSGHSLESLMGFVDAVPGIR